MTDPGISSCQYRQMLIHLWIVCGNPLDILSFSVYNRDIFVIVRELSGL
ncbi:hypothetical protein GCWU000342_01830 [Shuttleworthella satelles DSM 14600]|uniref:Uncharacterized protein n=1 Tax=Shuttleworthella satelles DSM 14600 TaxID=626523 RepID=C4GCY6_9FIRM|nr:hypothetical protein GCWU000342_01830 [Shuttleworthia satelles DSM 14600]